MEDIFKEVDMQFVLEMWFAEEDVGWGGDGGWSW